MASPTIVARTKYALTLDGDPVPTFVQTTGDLVVIFLCLSTDGPQTITVGDSFVNLTNHSSNFHIIYKVLDGSEGGNVAVTLGTDCKASAIAYNIQGHDTVQMPEISTLATAVSANPNPTTVTPTGGSKDYLWIAAFWQGGEEADDDTWCTGTPTDFGNLQQKTSGTGGGSAENCQGASADFASNASSMDPGSFTVAQAGRTWIAFTLAVHPPGAGADTYVSTPQTAHMVMTSFAPNVEATPASPTGGTQPDSGETFARLAMWRRAINAKLAIDRQEKEDMEAQEKRELDQWMRDRGLL